MTHKKILKLLESVKNGKTTVEQAYERLKDIPFEDLSHTKIDHHRVVRKGLQEVIFGEGKSIHQINDIIRAMQNKGLDILVTRVSKETGSELTAFFPLESTIAMHDAFISERTYLLKAKDPFSSCLQERAISP